MKDANVPGAGADNATVYFYNSTGLMDTCQTNSTGWCAINYNPANDSIPNNHTIYINSTRIGNEDSGTSTTYLEVKGVLFVNITSPLNGTSYSQSGYADLISNVTDESGNVISGSVARWYNETSLIASVQEYTNYPLISQSAGERNITCNSTKTYYYPGQSYVSIKITATANILWSSPTNHSEQPYLS